MKLERIISSSLYGKLYADVLIGGNVYSIYAPTVREYAEILEILGVGLLDSLESQLVKLTDNRIVLEKVIEIAAKKESGYFKKAHTNDLRETFNDILNLTLASDYFNQMPKTIKENKSKSTGGKTLVGQVASFIEDLGMSLNEVLNTSYPLLLMLQHDKPRPDYTKEDQVEEISGQEMLKRRK